MAEPFTLAALGATAALEGIKFLYGQATEVLDRWRARKDHRDAVAEAPVPVDQATAEVLLSGRLETPTVDFDILERLRETLRESAAALGNYAGGLDEPDLHDAELSATVDNLRRALEAVYGQRITFKGEERASSGPAVISRIEVEDIAGTVTGVRARRIAGSSVETTIAAGKVEEHGNVTGVDADTIG
ncbi:hypothetical protein ACIBU0_03550 [Streptomyces sp. NPDC049627]|uniref:hypothetical protein n=1 Tax=Streptomyces sp. NPDC049627 TaxID=3365595 RepID=UPI0037B97DF9